MRTFCIDLDVNVHRLKLGERTQVAKIADVTGLPLERLLFCSAERSPRKEVRLGSQWVQTTRLDRTYMRFCPHCIVEDNLAPAPFPGTGAYYRMQWFLPQLTTCIRHRKSIVQAAAPNGLETNSHDFCAILERLGSIEPWLRQSIDLEPTSFETYLEGRISSKPSDQSYADGLPLEAVIVMSERLGVAELHGRVGNPRKLTPDQIRLAHATGFDRLKAGEPGVKAVLDKMIESAPAGSQSAHGLYGTLYMALHQSNRGPEYNGFRTAIVEHAIGTDRLTTGTRMFDGEATVDAVRLRYLVERIGTDGARLRREIRKRGDSSGKIAKVNADHARELEEHFASLWTFSEATRFLGCKLRGLHSLFDENVLARGDRNLPQGYCRRQNIVDLAGWIEARATVGDGSHLASIPEALRASSSSIAEIVSYILTGKLPSVAVSSGLPILLGTRVSAAEVRQAHLPDGHVTAAEARSTLHLSATGFASLVGNGMLPAKSLGYPRQDWWVLDSGDVERFSASYVTLQECTAKTGLTANRLSGRAKRAGLGFAIPIEQAGQAIYNRRHVEVLCGGPTRGSET
jgi:hypothetical protein